MDNLLAGYDFQERSRKLDVEYADYLKGKTVAIVGRGGLDHLDQGDFIDSHDVVVRIHDMCPYKSGNVRDVPSPEGRRIMNVPEEWQSRIGKKCNILFFCHILSGDDEFVDKLFRSEFKAFRSIGGKFLCGENWHNHTDVCELKWQSEYNARYLTLDHWLNSMRAIGGSRPYAGTLAVTDILRHDIKSVYITGMPMFITRYNQDDPFGNPKANPVNDLNFIVGLSHTHPKRVSVDANMIEAWSIANGSNK